MTEFNHNGNHSVILNDRKHISVFGVKCVNGFSEDLVSVTTIYDEHLYIEGHDLTVEEVNLDKGFVDASGIVTGFFYEDKTETFQKNRSILKNLFVIKK